MSDIRRPQPSVSVRTCGHQNATVTRSRRCQAPGRGPGGPAGLEFPPSPRGHGQGRPGWRTRRVTPAVPPDLRRLLRAHLRPTTGGSGEPRAASPTQAQASCGGATCTLALLPLSAGRLPPPAPGQCASHAHRVQVQLGAVLTRAPAEKVPRASQLRPPSEPQALPLAGPRPHGARLRQGSARAAHIVADHGPALCPAPPNPGEPGVAAPTGSCAGPSGEARQVLAPSAPEGTAESTPPRA